MSHMKNKNKLVNVLLFATITYALKQLLFSEDDKKEPEEDTKKSMMEKKKEQLLDLLG